MKSYFILDLCISVPQIASGLGSKFTYLKIIRLYNLELLHYPFMALINLLYRNKDKQQKFVLIYASTTVSRIILLLHYLSFLWIWVGSEAFIGYEEGYMPWQFDNSDFEGYSIYRLYIFSAYWVCTVITTVGYGDYAGGTTVELMLTICLEFLGLVVFSVLQVAVLQVVNYDADFNSYLTAVEQRTTVWLSHL